MGNKKKKKILKTFLTLFYFFWYTQKTYSAGLRNFIIEKF